MRCQAVSQTLPPQQLALLEGQLTWLVYIVGAIIKGRLSSSSAEVGGEVQSVNCSVNCNVKPSVNFRVEGSGGRQVVVS